MGRQAGGSRPAEGSIDDLREQLLVWVVTIAAIVSPTPYCVAAYSAINRGRVFEGVGQLIVMLGVVSLALWRRGPRRTRATLFILLACVATAFAWKDLGYAVDPALLTVMSVVWAALLLGTRAATTVLVGLLIAMALSAYGHLSGLLIADPLVAKGGSERENWIAAGLAVTSISVALGVATAYILDGLEKGRQSTLEASKALRDEAQARLLEEEERREAELNLAELQRVEAVGQFAGGIAHDFNNLLTVICAGVEYLQPDGGSDPERREVYTDVMDAIESSGRLTRQLLTFSRRRARKEERVDLVEVVQQTMRLFRRLSPSRLSIDVALPKEAVFLHCDPTEIQQILLNLALNARDAVVADGSIWVSLEGASDGITLSVKDDGHGMDESTRAQVLRPLFTTKAPGEGTGLGLAVVARIVKEHGGTLEITSAPQKGTQVRVVLPLRDSPSSDAAPRPAALPGRGDEVVLLADDQPAVRRTLERALVSAGYTVVSAADGIAALERLQEAPPPDVLLTDISMPRMNGLILAKKARELRPDLPVVLLSGHLPDAATEKAVNDGGYLILEKPMTRALVLSALESVLESKRKAARR